MSPAPHDPSPASTVNGRVVGTLLIALVVGALPASLILGRNCDRASPVSMPTPVGPSIAGRGSSAPPVEFELETAAGRVDVSSELVNLPSGDVVTLARRPYWSFFGEGVGFEYPSDARVTVELAADGAPEIVAGGPGGLTVRVTPLRDDEDLAVFFPRFVELMLSHGLVRTGVARTLMVRGTPLEGTVLEQTGTGMRVELFAQSSAPRAVVAVYRPEQAVGDELPARILGTLRRERGEPLPEFDVLYGDARAPLAVDVPMTITAGGVALALTLHRRATVRRTLAGVSFEHDPRFAAAETHDGLADRVQLNYGGVAIQVIVATGIDPGSLRASLTAMLPTTSPPVTITHGAGPSALQGSRFAMSLGAEPMTSDVYTRDLGGRTVAILVQYQTTAAVRAAAALDTIATSLR